MFCLFTYCMYYIVYDCPVVKTIMTSQFSRAAGHSVQVIISAEYYEYCMTKYRA